MDCVLLYNKLAMFQGYCRCLRSWPQPYSTLIFWGVPVASDCPGWGQPEQKPGNYFRSIPTYASTVDERYQTDITFRPFKVIQDFGTNWKHVLCDFLAPFLRYDVLLAKKCLFFSPHSHSAPPLPMFPLEFRSEVNREETRVMGLSSS